MQTESTHGTKLSDEQLDVVAKLTVKINELSFSARFVPPIDVGPVISVYRFMPQGTTRVSNLEGLASDFAVVLQAEDVFVKRMPGESAVGIFVPNKVRTPVKFLDCINNVWAVKDAQAIPLNLGVDYKGRPAVEDLVTLPHLLVAGSTGAGKSTWMSSAIASILYCKSPDEVQFVLSDTKGVEFTNFVGAPHLLFEPATSIYQTLERLDWVLDEMGDRLKLISKAGLRNILEYNPSVPPRNKLTRIVVVIDELADLLLDRRKSEEDKGPSLGKIAESKISTIVQKSRAAGVHVIAGTQRPSVNVVVGSIKANFPARLTLRLPTGPDSRTVIGTEGAEHLLSQGDMLYVSPNKATLQRLHAPYARIEDIKAAVEAACRKEQQ